MYARYGNTGRMPPLLLLLSRFAGSNGYYLTGGNPSSQTKIATVRAAFIVVAVAFGTENIIFRSNYYAYIFIAAGQSGPELKKKRMK